VQTHPQKFLFVENSGEIPENLDNNYENPNEILKYLGKIPENLGKHGAQRFLTKSCTQRLQRNKCRHFLRSHQKNGRHFIGKFRKIWVKIFCIPKDLLAPTPIP